MKQHSKLISLWIVSFGLLFGQYSELPDGNENTATNTGNWLKIGTSIRANSMGGSAVANSRGIAGIPDNSASLIYLKGSEVYFAKTNYLAGITHNVISYGKKLSQADYFGLHLFFLDSGPMKVTNIYYPLGTGEDYKVTDFALRIAYARKITEKIGVGVVANYLRENIYTTTMQSLAFDAGLLYNTGLFGNVLGFNISNLGPDVQFRGEGLEKTVDDTLSVDNRLSRISEKFSLPVVIRYGLKNDLVGPGSSFIRMENHRLTLSADGIRSTDYLMYGAAGLEYSFNEFAFIRTGYNLGHDTAKLSAGAGLAFRTSAFALKVDYAFVDYGILKPVHQLAIGAEF